MADSGEGQKVAGFLNAAEVELRRYEARPDKVNTDRASLDRFWSLHDRELIGVESHEFASTMIAIGKILRQLAQDDLKPTVGLVELAGVLRTIAEQELATRERVAPR
ncbi:MAG: hypothetical protein ACKVP5_11585 [Aestuariivirga sp.]